MSEYLILGLGGMNMTTVDGKGEGMKEDIEKAKQTLRHFYGDSTSRQMILNEICQALASARAEERERCARIAESLKPNPEDIDNPVDDMRDETCKEIAEKIRKGG